MYSEWQTKEHKSNHSASWFAENSLDGYVAPKTVQADDLIGILQENNAQNQLIVKEKSKKGGFKFDKAKKELKIGKEKKSPGPADYFQLEEKK